MASEQLVTRLEAVTARLEKAANKLGGRGGGGGDDDDDEQPQYVIDFDNIVKTHVPAVTRTADKLGFDDMGPLLKEGYGTVINLIRATTSCKKPQQKELMTFLKPAVDAISNAETLMRKKPRNKEVYYKAFYESMVGLSWVTMAPPNGLPLQFMEGQQQSTDFNLNRILKQAKSAANKEDQQAFVKSFQALNKAVCEYIKEYFKKTGLEWKVNGKDLSSFSGGSPASEESKEQPKKTPKKPATGGGGGGMNAVFGQLSKGLNVTKGLKKVTKDMKTKNRKDRSGKVVMKKKAPAKKKKPTKPSSIKFVGGRWMLEHYYEAGVVEVDKADVKSNIYFTSSEETTFQIPHKVKAVIVDSCRKCRIFVSEVVSTVELVNCKSVTLVVQVKAPSISIEKCQSPRIILLKPAYEAKPDIYTSNVSAMNVEIPGKTESDDMVELPVPEQFITGIDPKTGVMTTEPTKHG